VAVEFRLLGAIEARVDDQVVDIGHARQRCVLAALLVQPGRPVPADVLIDHVWADQLPHHARNALSAYVSRLRGVLAATSDVQIVRGSGGYVLTADPMTVDLHRFRYLVSQARSIGDDEQATALYAEALELWQGEALATLDTPWVNNTRHSLAAERLSAELDRTDAELRLGRHIELVPELSIRAATYPLHERLAGQLMLALYRSGRQAEALAHYERMRVRLADELGVVPTAPLQELYQQILTTGPQASRPAHGIREVRREVQDLLERSVLLTQLDAALTGGRVVLVAGEAGIGKSALVRRFIQRREGDVRFLVGLCDPLLTPRALGPLRDIAVQVKGKLAESLAAGATRGRGRALGR
jgi:DNA-binding SARP family transcriptional activator